MLKMISSPRQARDKHREIQKRDSFSDRIAAVRDTHGPMKAHFFTHSAQGTEPYVRHDPPLVFNVERDPGTHTRTAEVTI
jgi:hypothetical protein